MKEVTINVAVNRRNWLAHLRIANERVFTWTLYNSFRLLHVTVALCSRARGSTLTNSAKLRFYRLAAALLRRARDVAALVARTRLVGETGLDRRRE